MTTRISGAHSRYHRGVPTTSVGASGEAVVVGIAEAVVVGIAAMAVL